MRICYTTSSLQLPNRLSSHPSLSQSPPTHLFLRQGTETASLEQGRVLDGVSCPYAPPPPCLLIVSPMMMRRSASAWDEGERRESERGGERGCSCCLPLALLHPRFAGQPDSAATMRGTLQKQGPAAGRPMVKSSQGRARGVRSVGVDVVQR